MADYSRFVKEKLAEIVSKMVANKNQRALSFAMGDRNIF